MVVNRHLLQLLRTDRGPLPPQPEASLNPTAHPLLLRDLEDPALGEQLDMPVQRRLRDIRDPLTELARGQLPATPQRVDDAQPDRMPVSTSTRCS